MHEEGTCRGFHYTQSSGVGNFEAKLVGSFFGCRFLSEMVSSRMKSC